MGSETGAEPQSVLLAAFWFKAFGILDICCKDHRAGVDREEGRYERDSTHRHCCTHESLHQCLSSRLHLEGVRVRFS